MFAFSGLSMRLKKEANNWPANKFFPVGPRERCSTFRYSLKFRVSRSRSAKLSLASCKSQQMLLAHNKMLLIDTHPDDAVAVWRPTTNNHRLQLVMAKNRPALLLCPNTIYNYMISISCTGYKSHRRVSYSSSWLLASPLRSNPLSSSVAFSAT